MKLHIAGNQHFSCLMCGRCCRRFHVLLRSDEIARLGKLNWGSDRPPCADNFVSTVGKYHFFRRNPENGACLFQEENQGCLIHRRFGYRAKSLACRGFPLSFARTFPGEISVLARYDCPAVLQNSGSLLDTDRKEIEALAYELPDEDGFTPEQLNLLFRPTVELIVDFFRSALKDTSLPFGHRLANLMMLADHLEKLGSTFLNDCLDTTRTILPNTLNGIAKSQYDWPRLPIMAFSRGYFRQWLSLYAQHDGELVNRGVQPRFQRVATSTRLLLGFGNLRSFSREHPDIPLRKVNLFPEKFREEEQTAEIWDSYVRFLDARLECYQFFGSSYYGLDFFSGLRALLQTFAIALAFARISAAAEGRSLINKADVDYAVASVDYAHGRTANLKLPTSRQAEKYFALPRFQNLLLSLGGY